MVKYQIWGDNIITPRQTYQIIKLVANIYIIWYIVVGEVYEESFLDDF
jgi:hypothetical protein